MQWALDQSRVGAPDVLLTGDSAQLEAVAREYNTAVEYPRIQETVWSTSSIPSDMSLLVADSEAEDVVAAADAIQRLCTAEFPEGEIKGGEMEGAEGVMVRRRQYIGFCDGGLAGKAVAVMREYVRESEGLVVGGVLVRGVAESVQCWEDRMWRGGGSRGFDADVGEMFLWSAGGVEVVVQMRGVVDEVG